MKITIERHSLSQAQLCELEYGTVLTDLQSHPDSLYIKVNKRFGDHEKSAKVVYPLNHCVLFNLKSFTIRSAHKDSIVTVLDAKLDLWRTNEISQYLRK